MFLAEILIEIPNFTNIIISCTSNGAFLPGNFPEQIVLYFLEMKSKIKSMKRICPDCLHFQMWIRQGSTVSVPYNLTFYFSFSAWQ